MTTATADRLLDAVRSGSAPEAIRSAAARGALPFPPETLVALQILLLDDRQDSVRDAAGESLAGVSSELACSLAAGRETPAEVVRYLCGESERWQGCGERLARRSDLSADAAKALAGSADPSVLHALAENQKILEADPSIGPHLLDNEALAGAARNRLLDVLEEIDKIRAAVRERTEAECDQGRAPATDPFLAALGVDSEIETLLPELGLDIGQLAEKSELLGDDDGDTLAIQLGRLNVGQKLRRAMFGTKEERSILVRDTNRVVACAVIKNPKFSDQEADTIAKSRNVNQEVLRLIGAHRDFAKSYQIQRSLVTNPRTPLEVSTRFIPRLQDRDLKLISGNRNLPENVRRQAKKLLDAREARRRVRLGPVRR
jgi:hypothetical protein